MAEVIVREILDLEAPEEYFFLVIRFSINKCVKSIVLVLILLFSSIQWKLLVAFLAVPSSLKVPFPLVPGSIRASLFLFSFTYSEREYLSIDARR